jgi:hypothetical protein
MIYDEEECNRLVEKYGSIPLDDFSSLPEDEKNKAYYVMYLQAQREATAKAVGTVPLGVYQTKEAK